jgi:uncharacterized protein YybS (DUF2232 family)
MVPFVSFERYRESAVTRWLNATFGEMTGIAILGTGLALCLFFYYLHHKAMAAPLAAKEDDNDRRQNPD